MGAYACWCCKLSGEERKRRESYERKDIETGGVWWGPIGSQGQSYLLTWSLSSDSLLRVTLICIRTVGLTSDGPEVECTGVQTQTFELFKDPIAIAIAIVRGDLALGGNLSSLSFFVGPTNLTNTTQQV